MPIDPDNVRVDLLKFRQKAYLSYPEGSTERKNFVKVILQNELNLTTTDFSNITVDYLVKGDKEAVEKYTKYLLQDVLATALFSMLSLIIFKLKFTWLALFSLAPIGYQLYTLYKDIEGFVNYSKNMNIVKQYSDDLKNYVNKISNEIRKLDGPR